MTPLIATIAVLSALIMTACGVTGWWRYFFAPFGIRKGKMTVERLGLQVFDPTDIERVNTILASFADGFNHMIAKPSATAWRAFTDRLPLLYQPFAHEGAAMGYQLRYLWRSNPRDFEDRIVRVRPEFRYLYYVGLGFWAGMKKSRPRKLMQTVSQLDPLHGYLCYDGYGFKHAFFDYPAANRVAPVSNRCNVGPVSNRSVAEMHSTQERMVRKTDPTVFRKFDDFDGYARNAAYHGVGRALYFLYMDRPDMLINAIAELGDHAVDAAAGVGLAAVFVNPDRLHLAQSLGSQMPVEWQPHFHLGMCFGLKARSINDVDQFEFDMSRLPRPVQDAAYASIRECDRVELQVRASIRALCASKGRISTESASDQTTRAASASDRFSPQSSCNDSGSKDPSPYQLWRDQVTQWMTKNIEYPMQTVKQNTESSIHAVSRIPSRHDATAIGKTP